ncbi:hypothetical protein AXG93_2334s1030 [Marchantia polymorpha subsp. ruderalis]|uniref:VOC domain-containing protein n=1 Tax=Marchantia polymorpha subsp. ruderalis TaxID=1480154 RepID=A0A176W4B5_MARPO|nr:hypothetical protein AXG93_2334s1030 [Marchantia polymorpha subsp. ruderalis]
MQVPSGGVRILKCFLHPAGLFAKRESSWIMSSPFQTQSSRVNRAAIRLQHLSSTLVGGSTLVVDSLHKRPFVDHNQTQRQIHEQHALRAQSGDMAQQAKFAYTVVYVPDVQEAVDFYQKAFGVNCRSVDDSKRWGEMESGATTIAFTPLKQRETKLTGGVQTADLSEQRHNVELSFSYPDVDAAFKHAVEAGAVPVAHPEDKEWGQRVGYVRDINGVMIRIGSFVES